MLWDLLQQRQIRSARNTADQAVSALGRTQGEIADLETAVDSLMLACQAMWELLREQGNLTDEMLVRRMQEVDLRDGKPDGRMRSQASTCPACSRQNHSRHGRCVYCGTVLPPSQHVFK